MGVEKCLFLLYCECMGNNRTTLESKAYYTFTISACFLCNNRTTLESKVYILSPFYIAYSVNNRTTLESKASTGKRTQLLCQVIIEPHWNLKTGKFYLAFDSLTVIIEPHWNLKAC